MKNEPRATTALRCLLLLFAASLTSCLGICLAFPRAAPGFTQLVADGYWPPISAFIMDPAPRMLAGLLVSNAISSYATVLGVEKRTNVSKTRHTVRLTGLFALSCGASGVVTWSDTLAAAEIPGPAISLHDICAALLFAGVFVVAWAYGARALGTASALSAIVYALLGNYGTTLQFNAWAEYAAAGLGWTALWVVAGSQ
jgi:hypothetical protein